MIGGSRFGSVRSRVQIPAPRHKAHGLFDLQSVCFVFIEARKIKLMEATRYDYNTIPSL